MNENINTKETHTHIYRKSKNEQNSTKSFLSVYKTQRRKRSLASKAFRFHCRCTYLRSKRIQRLVIQQSGGSKDLQPSMRAVVKFVVFQVAQNCITSSSCAFFVFFFLSKNARTPPLCAAITMFVRSPVRLLMKRSQRLYIYIYTTNKTKENLIYIQKSEAKHTYIYIKIFKEINLSV